MMTARIDCFQVVIMYLRKQQYVQRGLWPVNTLNNAAFCEFICVHCV